MKMIKSASIDITYDCNFRCLHCFNSSGEQGIKREYMTDEEIINTAETIIDMEPESLCLCGGETMLRKEVIYKVLDLRNKKNSNVSINCVSNGYLIDEEIASVLSKKRLNYIQISLDGATKFKHEWLRNKEDSFEKAINAIKLLVVQKNIYVAVAFTPNKKNIEELSDAIDLAKKLGVSYFRIQPIMLLGRAKKYLQNFIPDQKDYFKIKYIIEQKRRDLNDVDFIEWGDPIDHLHIGDKMNNVVSIGAYGDIIPSPYLPISVGNIKEKSYASYVDAGVLNIWSSNEFLNKMAEKIKEFDHMDAEEFGLPSPFTDEYILLDIQDENYELEIKKLMDKYNLADKTYIGRVDS